MRILHLMSCRGWSSDAYWAAAMVAELERLGHEPSLVCRRGSEARVLAPARAAGVSRIDTLDFRGGLSPVGDLAALGRIRSWLRGTDVIHVHRSKEHWLAALANRLSPTPRPLVRTRHIVQPIRPHAANRWLYRDATDLVVTVTHAIGSQLVAAGLAPPAKVVALPGGVDHRRFAHAGEGASFRAALGLAPDAVLVGMVSGLRVMKGHSVAVEAAARLAAECRAFHLLLIGRGAMEPQIRETVREAGLSDRVRLLGFLPDPAPALAALDVALYAPLESDGMSRALFEYLAAGKAVVASRVGVVPEVLVDGETALLVPSGEPAAMADALRRAVEDPALRAALGQSARALAESRFSTAQIARQLVSLYSGLVHGGRSGASAAGGVPGPLGVSGAGGVRGPFLGPRR